MFAALVAVSVLTGCGSSISTDRTAAGRPVALLPEQAFTEAPSDRRPAAAVPLDNGAVRKAIERYRIAKNRKPGPVQIGSFDLNGDGYAEALVLFSGPDWCARTGCSFVVFQLGKHGYELVSHSVRVRAPVRVGPGSSYGWRDLIVKTGGGPSPIRFVRLAFTGNGYPDNALLQPQPAEDVIAQAVELIAETDTAGHAAQVSATR